MTNLRRISLRDNYITELPLELHALSEGMISLIDVNNNGLKSPPPEIVSKGMECMFDYMRKMLDAKSSGRLDLSDMGLTYVPQVLALDPKNYALISTKPSTLKSSMSCLGHWPHAYFFSYSNV